MAKTVGNGETTTKPTHTTMIPLLAELSGNFHVAFAAIGAAVGIGLLGSKAAEATGRNPGAAGNILTLSIILAALIEGIVFFAIFLAK
jgi:F-type H+-transporting ATPase subunit c